MRKDAPEAERLNRAAKYFKSVLFLLFLIFLVLLLSLCLSRRKETGVGLE